MMMTSQSCFAQHMSQVTDAHAAVVAQFSQTVASWCESGVCLHDDDCDSDDDDGGVGDDDDGGGDDDDDVDDDGDGDDIEYGNLDCFHDDECDVFDGVCCVCCVCCVQHTVLS